ncbi:tripartite motif-containing protein 59 [Anguilla rostrata]|uniref:tripartite motif-containing protein 59 n=1 Tax=Anguilla rostrata TaxID=7938 RepID=UPI0030D1B445
MDDLEEDLTCSVCYSLFCDPRVLPCSHTFCKACLDNVQQVSGAFSTWRLLRVPLKCPNCRSVVELPPTGVEALPANVSLRAIIEKYQRDSWPRPPFCPQHPLQPLNVYCVQDRQLICGLCLTVGGHQGHAIDDLQAALAREREAAARLVERLTDGRWAELCARAERAEQERARAEGQLRQDREAVARFFQGLEQTLARKRLAFSAALDAAEAELGREYEPILERLKGMKEEQLELLSYGAAVAEEEAPLAYLQKVHALRERVEALMDTPLPQVRPLCVCPRAADFLEQQWAGVTLSELEQCPVPRIACCHDSRHRKEAPPPCPEAPHLSAALLIGLLALLISLCLGLIGFPQVFEQAVRDAALCLASLAANLQLQSTSLLSSLSDTAAQYLASIVEILLV